MTWSPSIACPPAPTLQSAVVAHGAHLGIALDGDADRVLLVGAGLLLPSVTQLVTWLPRRVGGVRVIGHDGTHAPAQPDI